MANRSPALCLPAFIPEDFWAVKRPIQPTPEQTCIMQGNDVIASAHLARIKERTRYALRKTNSDIKVIERIYFDGVTYPPELLNYNGSFRWFQGDVPRNTFASLALAGLSGEMPPLGTPCWCYVAGPPRPASKFLKIKWNVTVAEVSQLFALCKYQSILTADRNTCASVAACIDESHGGKAKRDAIGEKAKLLTLMAWGLLNWIDNQPIPFGQANKLTYDRNNYSVVELTLDAGDLVLLTQHEAAALTSRPHLCRLLRMALSGFTDCIRHMVRKQWPAAKWDDARRLASGLDLERPSSIAYTPFRRAVLNSVRLNAAQPDPVRREQRMDDSLITDDGDGEEKLDESMQA